MSLEQALEFIKDDELVEVTPKAFRLRKKSPRDGAPGPQVLTVWYFPSRPCSPSRSSASPTVRSRKTPTSSWVLGRRGMLVDPGFDSEPIWDVSPIAAFRSR
jgi:hypothetical protein